MKELLIKIRALFEGKGAEQAAKSLDEVADSANKVEDATSGLDNSLGGAVSGLGSLGDAGSEAGVGLNDLGAGLDKTTSSAGGGAFTGAIAGASAAVVSFAIDVGVKALQAVVQLSKAFAEGIAAIAGYADKLVELSTKTGQSIGNLVILEKAFENLGLKAKDIGPVMEAVDKAVSEAGFSASPAAAAFEALGIPIRQFSEMSAADKLTALATGLAGIRDPATRAAIQTALFKDEAELLSQALADTTAYQTASQQVGSLAANMEKAAPALNSFADAYNSLDVKKQQFFAGAAAQFATELERAGVALNELDLGPLGEQVGIIIRGAIEVGKEIAAWVNWVKQFTDALGLTGPILDTIKQGIMNALGPGGQLLSYFYETGEAAVKTERAQAEVTAEIEESRARAQKLIDAMHENHRLAFGTIDAIQQAGAAGVTGTADAATTRINEGGDAARTGIQETATQGAEQIQLTAEQIQSAAHQLASAFQAGMGQDISPALQALVNAVQASLQQMSAQIQIIVQNMASVTEQSQANLQTMGATVQQVVTNVQTTSTSLQTQLQTITQQMLTAQQAQAQSSEALQQAITTALQDITATIAQNNTTLVNNLQTQQQQLTTTLETSLQQLTATQQQSAQIIPQAFQSLTQAIATTNQQIAQAVQSSVQTISQELSTLQSSIVSGFQQMAQSMAQSNQNVAQGLGQVTNTISQGINQITTAITQATNQIGSSMSSAMGGIGNAIASLGGSISSAIARLEQMIYAVAARIR